MRPLKATLLDDDAFRLLAIPFGGPIPSPHSPIGVDLDGEWFDAQTDIEPDRLKARPVDWHHRHDGVMKADTIAKAVDPEMDEDGWWVTVWLDHGAKRLGLIKRLAEAGAQLFGSSEADPAGVVKASNGRIERWPYIAQALTTSPQNTFSVARPLKATVTRPLHEAMTRDLSADLRQTYRRLAGGDDAAKARRVLQGIQSAEAADNTYIKTAR